jgi:hypothetical protein
MRNEKPILFSGETEIWKSIEGYEGKYEISNYGRVKSLDIYHRIHSQKIMKSWINSNKKYLYITLKKDNKNKTFAVHRLVLEAFVSKKPPGKQCAHYDGDPQNNHLSNLRWATAKENIEDRKRHGRTAMGEKSGTAKLDEKCVKIIKKLKTKGLTAGEIAHLACVSEPTIDRIWKGETWRCVNE